MLNDTFSYQELPVKTSWKDLSDKEVWAAFLNGDKDAFQFIYQHNIDELFSYGMKVRHHRSLVKDCIHDLFVELWQRKSFLSFTNNIRFYLYRSLRRKIVQVVEREKKLFENTSVEDHSAKLYTLPLEQKFIHLQTEEEKHRKIELLLQKLSARQQEVIRLLFFDGLSYEQVSEIMAINVRSVYTLAWKAISVLRKSPALITFCFLFLH